MKIPFKLAGILSELAGSQSTNLVFQKKRQYKKYCENIHKRTNTESIAKFSMEKWLEIILICVN